MKIALASDVHLEFDRLDLDNDQNAQVLILAGDICVARDALKDTVEGGRVRDFFQQVSYRFPHVVYVMGNHEHYHGDFSKSADCMRQMFAQLHIHNVHLLDRGSVEIEGQTFLGGTLWTDFNRGDPLCVHNAGTAMNDYRGVKNTASGHSGGSWKFLPEHALRDHRDTLGYFKTVLANRRAENRTDPVVVVSHHAPTHESIHEWYKSQTLMNGNFASKLDDFILDHPEIAVWTHGHMHNPSDYQVGTTRVLCNPRGYKGYEARADEFELFYFEV